MPDLKLRSLRASALLCVLCGGRHLLEKVGTLEPRISLLDEEEVEKAIADAEAEAAAAAEEAAQAQEQLQAAAGAAAAADRRGSERPSQRERSRERGRSREREVERDRSREREKETDRSREERSGRADRYEDRYEDRRDREDKDSRYDRRDRERHESRWVCCEMLHCCVQIFGQPRRHQSQEGAWFVQREACLHDAWGVLYRLAGSALTAVWALAWRAITAICKTTEWAVRSLLSKGISWLL